MTSWRHRGAQARARFRLASERVFEANPVLADMVRRQVPDALDLAQEMIADEIATPGSRTTAGGAQAK